MQEAHHVKQRPTTPHLGGQDTACSGDRSTVNNTPTQAQRKVVPVDIGRYLMDLGVGRQLERAGHMGGEVRRQSGHDDPPCTSDGRRWPDRGRRPMRSQRQQKVTGRSQALLRPFLPQVTKGFQEAAGPRPQVLKAWFGLPTRVLSRAAGSDCGAEQAVVPRRSCQ